MTERKIQLDQNFSGNIEAGDITVNICAKTGTVSISGATHIIEDSSAKHSQHGYGFTPDEAVIHTENVPLNRISPCLKDTDDTAKLLAPPTYLETHARWDEAVIRVHSLKDHYGIDGAPLLERLEKEPQRPYEAHLADYLRDVSEHAQETGEHVTTGWFLPPLAAKENMPEELASVVEDAPKWSWTCTKESSLVSVFSLAHNHRRDAHPQGRMAVLPTALQFQPEVG